MGEIFDIFRGEYLWNVIGFVFSEDFSFEGFSNAVILKSAFLAVVESGDLDGAFSAQNGAAFCAESESVTIGVIDAFVLPTGFEIARFDGVWREVDGGIFAN